MKFLIQTTTSTARSGIVKDIFRLPDFQFETPYVFLFTKGGNIPYITQELWEMIKNENTALHIPLTSISNIEERIKLYNKPIADFIGMKNCLTYLTIIDPEQEPKEAPYKKGHVSFWTKNGRKEFNAESYLELVKNVKPDMFTIISDTFTPKQNKKFDERFETDVNVFNKSLEIYKNSDASKNSEIIGTLAGRSDLKYREKFSKVIGESPVFGVVVDGLGNNGAKTADLNIGDVKPLIEASLKYISDDKLRIVHGCWNPRTALHLIELGIDILDSSYPYIIAEQGGALNFVNDKRLLLQDFVPEMLNSVTEEPLEKKQKLESKFFTSLHDPEHVQKFEPILSSCTCLACRNYTQAYIHHLLNVKELLGMMLLMIHNLHHYLNFFTTIRTSVKNNEFEILKKNFDSLYS